MELETIDVERLFLVRYGAEIIQRTGEHFAFSRDCSAIATLVGIPLGIVITRKTNLRQPILGIANVLQTIPSLALFGLLIPVRTIGGIGIIRRSSRLLYSLLQLFVTLTLGSLVLIQRSAKLDVG